MCEKVSKSKWHNLKINTRPSIHNNFFQESEDKSVQLRGEQLQERWEQWSSVLGSLAVDASFLSVMPSQWDWVGKQRSWWEADLYICIGSSSYGGWIPLMGPLATLASLQANPSKGISCWHARLCVLGAMQVCRIVDEEKTEVCRMVLGWKTVNRVL